VNKKSISSCVELPLNAAYFVRNKSDIVAANIRELEMSHNFKYRIIILALFPHYNIT